jgi:hypothetical protein
MTPGRGLALGVDWQPVPQIKASDGSVIGIEPLMHYSAKVRFPLLLHKRLKLIGGLGWSRMRLGQAPSRRQAPGEPISSLEGKGFKTLESRLYAMYALNEQDYLRFRAAYNREGVFDGWGGEGLTNQPVSLGGLWIHKSSQRLEWGLGLFGEAARNGATVVPAALVNYNITKRWGLEARLPSYVRLRHRPHRNGVFYLGLRGRRDRFWQASAPAAQRPGARLRYFEHRYLDLEAEWSHCWWPMVWTSLRGGYHYSLGLRTDWSEAPRAAPQRIGDGWFLGMEISLRPPR